MKLADPSLLKDKCLVDGKWVGEGVDPIIIRRLARSSPRSRASAMPTRSAR